MTEFKDKVVIVTGANSGIGQAQAQAFLAQGSFVYAIDKQECTSLQNESNCLVLKHDLSKPLAKELIHHDKIDILCNTCGILDDYLPLMEMSDELWFGIIGSNLTSYMYMTKLALTRMLPFHEGTIINMASIAGLIPGGGGFAYTASKHAVVGMTKQLTYDYAKEGIKVNAIAPGAIKTAMTASDFAGDGVIARQVAEEIPIKRYASPEEVAELTLFLASSKSDYLQGSIIPIDGGWLCR